MRCVALVLLLASFAAAQASGPDPAVFVTREFGASFKIVKGIAPMRGDLDGDGIEDIVLVATNKNPMSDEAGKAYKVIDPYNAYFGFGNPQITVQFAAKDPGASRHILIAHSWQAETPKSKFVVINLPFDKLEVSHFTYKKKTNDAVIAHELGGLNSAVYWDGKKKYRWQPLSHDE